MFPEYQNSVASPYHSCFYIYLHNISTHKWLTITALCSLLLFWDISDARHAPVKHSLWQLHEIEIVGQTVELNTTCATTNNVQSNASNSH